MPSRIFFFSDIDDTLMQTKRKTDFTQSTVVGGYTKEGEENSFFYEGTKLLIDTLIASNITFVPTTARNRDSYERTVFAKEKAIKYVILNFGGTILIDGKIDQEWEEKMNASYAKIISIENLYKQLNNQLVYMNVDLIVKIIDDNKGHMQCAPTEEIGKKIEGIILVIFLKMTCYLFCIP